jgi:hypothetical protein
VGPSKSTPKAPDAAATPTDAASTQPRGTGIPDGSPDDAATLQGAASPVSDASDAPDVSGEPDASVGADAGEGSGVLVLFGGTTQTNYPGGFYGDTWTWNGSTWTEVDDGTTGLGPSPRVSGSAALNGNVVLFGGAEDQDNTGNGMAFQDTWAWAQGSWTEVGIGGFPPSPRYATTMATLNGDIVLFGGSILGGALNDTWTWDGTQWAQVAAGGVAPAPRVYASMAALNGSVVLFGGYDEAAPAGAYFADTWTWDGTSWTEVSTGSVNGTTVGPGPRSGAAIARLGDQLVLFGGEPNCMNDTWTWDGTSWTQVDDGFGVTVPPPRVGASMATLDGNVVLFGGQACNTADGFLGDTWIWNGATWTQMPVTGPSPRYLATMSGP